MSEPVERWRPVVGFEDLYAVSDQGRIKSLARRARTWYGTKQIHECVMRTPISRVGYPKAVFWRDSKATHTTVHATVLRAFVGEPESGQEARHLNGVRSDCRLENLAWSTHAENMDDQVAHGTRRFGQRHPRAKLTNEVAAWIRESQQSGAELASILGMNITAVCKARRGETYSAISAEGEPKFQC